MINIFDIERYATKDGPGIRTVLFFKGCNLHCRWCQNPESQILDRQVMYYKSSCSGCGKCIDICPENAVQFSELEGFITNHEKCTRCGRCIDACFYNARRMVGQYYSIEQVMVKILADKSFYDESGGGVTFSGGEPLLFYESVKEIAFRCKAEGIHTAIETAGAVNWEILEKLLDCIDLFYVDMKHIDPELHRKYTGMDNIRILKNIVKLSRLHPNVIIRIPVIPGINHSEEVMHKMLSFIAEQSDILTVELLPFHRLGTGKYSGLGMEYLCADLKNVEKDECDAYVEFGINLGLSIHTGAV